MCKDCKAEGITKTRPAPYPGPRCATHHRTEKRRRSVRAHAKRIEALYDLSPEEYWKIYEYQGNRCAICQRSRGIVKRLAVDHDHHAGCGHHPEVGCSKCVRALLCSGCNQLIGRYDVAALQRAIGVLTDPPAQRVLGVSSA